MKQELEREKAGRHGTGSPSGPARSAPGPRRGASATVLACYHQQHSGRISELLRSPEIAATFDNWHG
jgi:hypothetical protein